VSFHSCEVGAPNSRLQAAGPRPCLFGGVWVPDHGAMSGANEVAGARLKRGVRRPEALASEIIQVPTPGHVIQPVAPALVLPHGPTLSQGGEK
jgi:hypothetical protein